MSKYRVFEIAKEFHTESKVVLDILKKGSYKVANHLSSVGDEERNFVKSHFEENGFGKYAKTVQTGSGSETAA